MSDCSWETEGSVGDDFVLVDADNEPIPANAEASALMAAELGNELEVHDTDEWYLVGMEEARELTDRLDAFIAASSTASEGRLPEKSTMCAADKSQGPSTTENEDPEDDDGGMEECFSREYSDQSDEWVLEDILKRRVCKDGPSPHEYLCKWKWYREPTWEPRVGIEELGYVRQLDEFDRQRKGEPQPTSGKGHVAEDWADHLRLQALLGASAHVASLRGKTLEEVLGDSFLQKMKDNFRSCKMNLLRYAPVGNHDLERKFLKRWSQDRFTHCPMLLFHGTRHQNIYSIAMSGFKVPGGNGVRVLNGSVFGLGVYAAKNSSYSRTYSDSNLMFACVGLVGPQYITVKEHGGIVVFGESCLIVPIFLVQFSREGNTAPPDMELEQNPTRVSFAEVYRHGMLKHRGLDGHERRLSECAKVARPNCGLPSGLCHSGDDKETVKRFTKKMLKQLPRKVKEYYKNGMLQQPKQS